MTDGGFEERRKALEGSFFHRRDKELLEYLQSELEHKERREQLQTVSGIDDAAVLDKMIQLDISVETLTALTLVPLVRIAWADNKVQGAERGAILTAAHDQGIEKDSAGHQLLDSWLTERPEIQLTDAWMEYVRTLCGEMNDAERASLKRTILGRATQVAESAGGVLGLGSISEAEKNVLRDLARAFDD